MMMKKRRIQVMFTVLTAAAVFFTGCLTYHNGTGKPGGTEPEDGKTYILFQNASPYAVDVYSDSGRGAKAASVPAGRESKLEWTPSPDGSSFYLTYQIPVGDDVVIPYNSPRIGPYRIDEGKTTSIAIGNPVSSPNLLTDHVYLLLYNESDSETFYLEQQGGTLIKPEKIYHSNESVPDGISLVNPSERAWYIISAGPAAAYSVSASGVKKPFPNGYTRFQAGRFYTFHYRDGDLALDTVQRISLEVLLSRREVTFDAAGGSPATQTRPVNSGDSLGAANMPAEPAKSGYIFDGWYTAANGGGTQFTADTVVSANITVYAKWNTPMQAALAWLDSNAEEGWAYTITLSEDESVSPQTLSYSGKAINIILKGDSAERTVSLNSNGSLFTVESGVTLTLDNNITLRGQSRNTDSLVQVRNGGTLEMNSGAKLINNSNYSFSFGGGVYVSNGGTFTMNGGIISGNSASSDGGGAYVNETFAMNGGTISDNPADRNGGGVCVISSSAAFTMHAGTISGNTARYGGGGVYVDDGRFTKSVGIIYGSNASDGLKNTAGNGHAAYVSSRSNSGLKKRNSTAGEGVPLDSEVSGSAGGWE
jgi:uncharacterized repeat protein (TIGR02543 family)